MFKVEKTKTGAVINGYSYTFSDLAAEDAIDRVERETGLSRVASAHAVSIGKMKPKEHVTNERKPLITR